LPVVKGAKVTPASAGWRYVGFEVLRLARGQRVERRSDDTEVCLVVVAGRALVGEWEVGGRATPFDSAPEATYLPPRTAYPVEALTDLELAIGSAPAGRGARARVLRSPRREIRGSGSTERTIHHILMEDQPAERLLVTEVVTPGGHWSSYPPHKHDTDDPPRECYLEETYYHRLRRAGGFAIQRVYSADRSLDETLTVTDGDTVMVPRGYHPVAAAAGYDLYYLNVMAGPVRQWRITFDPEHQWLA